MNPNIHLTKMQINAVLFDLVVLASEMERF